MLPNEIQLRDLFEMNTPQPPAGIVGRRPPAQWSIDELDQRIENFIRRFQLPGEGLDTTANRLYTETPLYDLYVFAKENILAQNRLAEAIIEDDEDPAAKAALSKARQISKTAEAQLEHIAQEMWASKRGQTWFNEKTGQDCPYTIEKCWDDACVTNPDLYDTFAEADVIAKGVLHD